MYVGLTLAGPPCKYVCRGASLSLTERILILVSHCQLLITDRKLIDSEVRVHGVEFRHLVSTFPDSCAASAGLVFTSFTVFVGGVTYHARRTLKLGELYERFASVNTSSASRFILPPSCRKAGTRRTGNLILRSHRLSACQLRV